VAKLLIEKGVITEREFLQKLQRSGQSTKTYSNPSRIEIFGGKANFGTSSNESVHGSTMMQRFSKCPVVLLRIPQLRFSKDTYGNFIPLRRTDDLLFHGISIAMAQ
jgi:hypothetical protein